MRMLIFCFVCVLSGCGDSAAKFVGFWSGTQIERYSVYEQPASTTSAKSFAIEEDRSTGKLLFSDECGMTASASGSSFSVDEFSGCLVKRAEGGACGIDIAVNYGSGELASGALVLTLKGTASLDSCPDGGTGAGDYEIDFSGTR